MPTFLKHVTEADEKLLLAQGERISFRAGEKILNEGEERHAIFLIRKGGVRIELDHPEFNIEIARLEVGDLFGEMSFLDDFRVSASVIANEDTEVDVVEATTIKAMTDQDARFYGRFYQSLAQILSTRLRDTTLRGFG